MGNEDENQATSYRDDDSSLNPLQKYVMGDMAFLNRWLDDKPTLVQMPNWFLRGVGAPIFLNNPISGEGASFTDISCRVLCLRCFVAVQRKSLLRTTVVNQCPVSRLLFVPLRGSGWISFSHFA